MSAPRVVCPTCGEERPVKPSWAPVPQATPPLSTAERAVVDVRNERTRQIEAEGWSTDHDDEEHYAGQLARAAAAYALAAAQQESVAVEIRPKRPACWPWDPSWWKPSTARRNLVKAGALILAEIERLDRDSLRAHAAPEEPKA